MINAVAEFGIVEQNLRAAMQVYSLATDIGRVREMPGVSLIASGLDIAVFNAALVSTPTPGPDGDLARRIALAQVFFDAHALPWSFWLCEDMLDRANLRASRGLFERQGMQLSTQPTGMYTDALGPLTRALPSLECRPVDGEATRLAFADITSMVFDLAFPAARQIYDQERIWRSSFRGYVGYWRGKPVSTAAVVEAAGALGVYSVGTLPEHRRQGFAECLVRCALARERERTGIERTVLQSTRQGRPLYEAMGYRAVTKFTIYLTP